MNKRGVQVTIDPELQKKIDELWVKYPDIRIDGQDFESNVNAMLATAVEIEEHCRKKILPLHLIAVLEASVILGDVEARKIVCVDFDGDGIGLRCREHNSQRCVHVGYCMAIPRVYQLLAK
jgi:hypothetical protein